MNEITEQFTRTNAGSFFPKLTRERNGNRRVRVVIRLPRRQACMTKRAMLAALHEAELHEWLNSGGDYLDHNYHAAMHQPVH